MSYRESREMHDAVCADCGQNVKSLSNLTEADLYTAKNAIEREDPQEEIDTKLTS